jgi:hypothetical protein
MNRGYVTIAQNTEQINYVGCAEVLAISLHRVMPECSVTLITDKPFNSDHFDKIVYLKPTEIENDPFRVANDVQVYDLSPYDYTIKLEADMFIPQSIDHWWDVLIKRDLVVSSTIRDFRGNISDCRTYRRFIDDNDLPDVYNAVTYFRKSKMAADFFQIVNALLKSWPQLKTILKCNANEPPSTDWLYAIACHVLGPENTTLPGFDAMSMTHMKQMVNNLPTEDWTQSLVHELTPDVFRVNTFTQHYPFHYHVKPFSAIIRERL